MNLDGAGHPQFNESSENDFITGRTDSDFYTTFRGRLGWASDWNGCGLLYGTGGGIRGNYETHYRLDDVFNAGRTDFNWGYCVGGGIERQIMNRHWSIKPEYLYFNLDQQDFHQTVLITSEPMIGIGPRQQLTETVRGSCSGETFGHIIRAGLNYHF